MTSRGMLVGVIFDWFLVVIAPNNVEVEAWLS